MVNGSIMHEILPCPFPALISPSARGELSLLSPSEFDVQRVFPRRNGLVGNSRMVELSAAEFLSPDAFTGFRNTSTTRPAVVTTATALRSLASTQMFPATSKAIPSAPSRIG